MSKLFNVVVKIGEHGRLHEVNVVQFNDNGTVSVTWPNNTLFTYPEDIVRFGELECGRKM
jgi:hypothetical protein